MNENNENKNLSEDMDEDAAIKAFKTEFCDNAEQSIAPDEQSHQTVANPDLCEEHDICGSSEPDNFGEQSDSQKENDDADPSSGAEEIKVKKRRKTRKISTKTLIRESNLALCLSAISIILLAAIAALLTVGILPAGNRMVYVGVSTLGPVETPGGAASAELLEEFKKSVVIIDVTKSQGGGTGSGIVISSDGFIVTNYHVIEGAKKISVTFYGDDQKKFASVIGYSERDDIAVIKVSAEGLSAAVFAKSADCRVGDRVYAVGAPEGSDFGWTITSGIISNPLREIKIYESDHVLDKKMYLLQTDTPVNPGNSGGPLINARGEVVGIITLKRSDAEGLGFALPSTASLEIIDAIIETGNADRVTSGISKGRPLIGITGVGLEEGVWYELTDSGVNQVSSSYAKNHPDTCIKLTVSGIYVTSLTPNLDASNHLLVGDVITRVNNIKVYTIYDVMDVVNEYDGGDTITITFVRDGKTNTANIILGTEQ